MTDNESHSEEVKRVPTRIFVSHKWKDREAARGLKDLLSELCQGVDVFLSSDAADFVGGVPWGQQIQDALAAANRMVLIYTTPQDNWDRCFYECGYFAGRGGAAGANALVVMHPPGVVCPEALAAWRSVPAEPAALTSFLEGAFHLRDPACHRIEMESHLAILAKNLATAIAPEAGRIREALKLEDRPHRGDRVNIGREARGDLVNREQLLHGVVHEIVDEDAIVILEDGTQTERRVMSRDRLRAAGVLREGDSFDIRVREVELPGRSGVHVETDIYARTEPWVVEPVRPGLDLSKFKTPA